MYVRDWFANNHGPFAKRVLELTTSLTQIYVFGKVNKLADGNNPVSKLN